MTAAAVLTAVLTAVLLAAGAAGVGTLVRWAVLTAVRRRGLTGGTAWVNVPASTLAGVVVGVTGADRLTDPAAAPWVAWTLLGLCGGLSTWSSLALETATALRDGDRRALAMSAAGTLLGLVAGVVGLVVGAASAG